MTEEEIKNHIFLSLKEIAPDTEPSQLQLHDNFRQSLNLDSFDFLHFITALDEKLHLTIPEEDYGQITTLGSLMAYIQARR